MSGPVTALLAFSGLVLLGYALFRYPSGLYWRWARLWKSNERVRIEDALKHLYDYEYQGRFATIESLSGALELSADRTADLIARLETLKLLRSGRNGLELTPEGRSGALRVIRNHRLWERSLADQSGLSEMDWHREADRLEHTMSPEEADAFAARMGNPRYDPHGDAIPTAEGELPPPQGEPLTELPAGGVGAVVHVEDEPAAVYAQLVALGVAPGMTLRIIESTPKRIVFEMGGKECVLAPVVAANVSVITIARKEWELAPGGRLSELELGKQARVVGIAPSCRALQRRRLLDLGLIPGTVVEAELRSPGGDPTAYQVRGALIALRREQTDLIHVSHENGGDDE